jgi:micrococcal nuclease
MKRLVAAIVVGALAILAVWILATRNIDAGVEDAGGSATIVGGESPRPTPPDDSPVSDLASPPVPAGAEVMTVVSVHDGDTLRLRDRAGFEENVRIIGIDTTEVYPEYECFGDEATDALARLAPVGAELRVSTDEDPFDRYDRLLLYLWTDDGVLINLALVADGFGEAIRVGDNDRYFDLLRAAESSAQAENLGMWGSC